AKTAGGRRTQQQNHQPVPAAAASQSERRGQVDVAPAGRTAARVGVAGGEGDAGEKAARHQAGPAARREGLVILLPVLMFFQAAAAQGQLPEVVTRPRLERNGGVDFHALVVPETVYVGQQATYELGVFLDQETRGRLRRNPEFIPPESRAMLA